MNAKFLITGGFVFFPQERAIRQVDIEIVDGRISRIGSGLSHEADVQIIEASSKLISPGFIDLHVHLREPGREDKETLASGAMAALAGGFTTICAMPNTSPPTDTREQAAYIKKTSQDLGLARILPIGTATKGRGGKEISEYAFLKEGGAVAFSDDGDWIVASNVMQCALEYADMLDMPVITHAEDPSLCEDGVMNESKVSAKLGLAVRPAVAEEIALSRDLALAAYTKAHLHVAHLSTKKGVEMLRAARAAGVRVTAEVSPHHLTLTDEALAGFDSNYKLNPPLRTEDDRLALIEGLLDGTIQAIATDHAPHSLEEKEQELNLAPAGIIGLQTALPVVWEALVKPNKLRAELVLAALTQGPASVIGLSKNLEEGIEADLVIFNPERRWIFNSTNNKSLSENSPWFSKELTGKIEHVFLQEKHFEF